MLNTGYIWYLLRNVTQRQVGEPVHYQVRKNTIEDNYRLCTSCLFNGGWKGMALVYTARAAASFSGTGVGIIRYFKTHITSCKLLLSP